MSPWREHIKKESNKTRPEDQGEGEEIARRDRWVQRTIGAPQRGGRGDGIDYPQHLGSDIICDYYSLCGVSLSCAKTPAKRRFLRTSRIDEPRVRLSHARESRWIANRETEGGSRDARRVRRNSGRREEQPKTDGSFAYARYENASPFRCCFTLDEFVLANPVSAHPLRALLAS